MLLLALRFAGLSGAINERDRPVEKELSLTTGSGRRMSCDKELPQRLYVTNLKHRGEANPLRRAWTVPLDYFPT